MTDADRAAQIAANLETVRNRIAAAARACGRTPASIRLVAVSKKMPEGDIRAALVAGQLDFGENYAQELRDKRAALADLPIDQAPRWHYIGPLQSNKVKYVAGACLLIHALDGESLCDDVHTRIPAGAVQDCLIQVNVAAEPQKRGTTPDALTALLDAFARWPRLRCVGLMTMPPLSEDPGAARPHFVRLRGLRDAEATRPRPHVALTELSMGMSHDLEVAIAEGATLVRVGTAIFGSRG